MSRAFCLQGDLQAADQLLPLVYAELREAASKKLGHEAPGYDRAVSQGMRFGCLTFDEWYGGKPQFLRALQTRGQQFVGEIPKSFMAWIRHPRVTHRPLHPKRRGRGRRTPFTDEIKYFLSNAPADTAIKKLLRVAFGRWHIERCFEDGKGEVGLDHWEGRRWIGLKRHLILTTVSYLFLAKTCQRLRGEKSGVDRLPSEDGHGRRCLGLATPPRRSRPSLPQNRRAHRVSLTTQRPRSRQPQENDNPQITPQGHQAGRPAPMRRKHKLAL